MKKILIVPLLIFSLSFLSGCAEEEAPSKRTVNQEALDKKDNLYRKMARFKEDVMAGHLEGWRARLDALWIYGDIIDPQMVEYMTDIKRIAQQKEKQFKEERTMSDLIVEPKIDANITVTEEILTTYLQEILAGIEAETLKKWEVLLDKVYLHGKQLTDKHYEIIQIIETKGREFNKILKEEKKNEGN